MKPTCTSFIFGNTAMRLPILAHRFNRGGKKVLILGGVHGDEIEGVICAHGLLAEFHKSFPYVLDITLIPSFNTDGVLLKTRTNFRGVDLNRNLPTKDWSSEIKSPRYHPGPQAASEPENQALIHWLEQEKPNLIISLHSWEPLINVNGDCMAEAQKLSALTGYKIEGDIGYPTPGCLGTYAGLERHWPTITYEIQRGQDLQHILQQHVPAILQTLHITESK